MFIIIIGTWLIHQRKCRLTPKTLTRSATTAAAGPAAASCSSTFSPTSDARGSGLHEEPRRALPRWRARVAIDADAPGRRLTDALVDRVYGVVARARYRAFGRPEQGLTPRPEYRNRFVD